MVDAMIRNFLRFGIFAAATIAVPALTIAQSNPWVDVTAYGARAVTTVPQTTTAKSPAGAGCTEGSPVVYLADPSSFRDGDGIVLYNCGAPANLETPAAPKVTPSLISGPDTTTDVVDSAAGSTNYSYQIIARDKNGGLTAASDYGKTATGSATLGIIRANVSSLARKNNVVTVKTESPNGAAKGAVVFVTNSSDATFSGFFVVSAVRSETEFEFSQGMDTRAGASTSAKGGTVQVYNCNHIAWESPKDRKPYQYYIYGRTASDSKLIGISRPGENSFNDCGPVLSAPPSVAEFVPQTPPSSAAAGYLATTIKSGGGSRTLTLATAARSTSSGRPVKFDDGPAIAAAYAAMLRASGGSLYFPTPRSGSYVINSHTIFAGAPATVLQSGPITLNETLETGLVMWTGLHGGVGSNPQFSFNPGEQIRVGTAYPGVALINGSSMQHVALSGAAQGLISTVSGGYLNNSTLEYDSFVLPSTDFMGQAVVGYGMSNAVFRYVLFSANNSSTYGYSLTPLALVRNDVSGENNSGEITCEHCFFVGRAFGFDSTPVVGGGTAFRFEDTYAQGIRTPLIEAGKYNGPLVRVNRFLNDTSITATIADWGSNLLTATLINVEDNSMEAAGRPGVVTGNLIYGLTIENGGDYIGQNRDMFQSRPNETLSIPLYSASATKNAPAYSADFFMSAPLHFPAQNSLFWDLPAPASVTAAPSGARGTIAPGSWYYAVTSIGADNAATKISQPSAACVTTKEQASCEISWDPVPGAIAYSVYRTSDPKRGYGSYGGVETCTRVVDTSCKDSAMAAGGGTPPSGTGTGSTIVEQNQIVTPQVVLTSPDPATVSSTATIAASKNGDVAISGLAQSAGNRFAGSAACSGSKKTISLPAKFATPPVILVFDETTKGGASLSAKSTSSFTVSCSGESDAFDWLVIGNPN